MDFTPRLRQIILALLSEPQVLSAKNLAERIHVSKRTVQRELEYTGSILRKYRVTLCSKTGVGIWLEGEEEDKQVLRQLLESRNVMDCADKEERRKRLMLELLRDQEPKKLYYFGNKFGVSEATISKDMERIQKWFDSYRLNIVKKPGLGVALMGSERDYRTAVREFIAENMDTPIIQGIYEGLERTAQERVRSHSIKSIYQILDDEILERVCTCFASIRDERITRLTQESYTGLVIHVTIAVERVQKGEIMEENPGLMSRLREDADFHLALLILDSLEEEFEIELPDIELAYICLHIKGAKLQRSDCEELDELSPESREEIREFVHEMIVAYDERIADILETDEEFTGGLAAHLRPTLVRIRNQMPIENPHLEEMKNSYPEIFKRCLNVGKYLKARTGMEIPESEIGFLTIHFGAAMVRLENERTKKRVVDIGLVCASGIGISRLMASRLQKYMKSRVKLTTYGKEDLTPYAMGKEDFFVSSMRVEELEADVVSVSPLLPEQDLKRIEEQVARYETQPKLTVRDTDFARQLEMISALSTHIKEILRGFCSVRVESWRGFPDTIRDMAGQLFHSQVCCDMVTADLRKREEIATQVVPELGIALLHARTSGVMKPCIYLGLPGSGEAFTHPYFQGIQAVIMMLIPQDEWKEENSRLMGCISQKLAEDEGFAELLKQGEEERIREQLGSILKQYFNRYLDEQSSSGR